ncbi:MAG: hypothetical protein RLN85_00240, partial [Pseudomonadales bacterium]
VAIMGNGEQQADIGHRNNKDQSALKHPRIALSISFILAAKSGGYNYLLSGTIPRRTYCLKRRKSNFGSGP